MNELSAVAERLTALLGPDDARDLLARNVGSELGFLNDLAGDGGLNHALTCKALVAFYGFGILFARETRAAILTRLPGPAVDEVWEFLKLEGNGTMPDTQKRRTALIDLVITQGSLRARRLCEALELPYECVGDSIAGSPSTELFAPYIKLPPLHDYQDELSSLIVRELLDKGDRRAMLALPTGGGKTRVVLETLLNWAPLEQGLGALLWVAQHAELCEQAIECVAQLWASRERPSNRTLRVQRVWAGKSEEIDWGADVVVGIPESLQNRVLEDRKGAKARLRLVVIDEAHLSTASVYDPIFRLSSEAKVPVLGVSATPANPTDPSGALQRCYDTRLLRASALGREPYANLRDREVLSDIEFENLSTGVAINLTEEERFELRGDSEADYSSSMLNKIGRSHERNRAIAERLDKLPAGVSTLCFASSVPAARALASAMTIMGRTATVIDATTPTNLRKRLLAAFKAGEIQFLFNFGVLATGFDAPKVECLVLARPTRSMVLLEQMIGRGLRGPRNGGTATCRLIWVEDDFANAGELRPQSYERFAKLWKV